MIEKDPKWAILVRKYPERAGRAYELYMRDPNKGKTNPTTYFNYAMKLIWRDETNYQRNLQKYINKQSTQMELQQ